MCESIKVFSSLDRVKNRRAKEALQKIPWIEVEWFAPFKLLEEVEELPFIYTDEGDRYFGVGDIEYFVEGQLKRGGACVRS